jgi:predicted TIM-barrel fold metal-dependent hydrolase
MLDKHPHLNVTFAHFFFLSFKIDEAKRVMEKYPNVKFDLTPGHEMYLGFSQKIDEWQRFFEEYSDRILFGTDADDLNKKEKNQALNDLVYTALTHDKTEYEMPVFKRTVKGLDLTDSTVKKICYDNYIKFAGDTVKPINDEFLIETAEKMLYDIKDLENAKASCEWLKTMILQK